jgi:hypothetical protein
VMAVTLIGIVGVELREADLRLVHLPGCQRRRENASVGRRKNTSGLNPWSPCRGSRGFDRFVDVSWRRGGAPDGGSQSRLIDLRSMASTAKRYVTQSLGGAGQSGPARDHASAWLSNMTSRESQLP